MSPLNPISTPRSRQSAWRKERSKKMCRWPGWWQHLNLKSEFVRRPAAVTSFVSATIHPSTFRENIYGMISGLSIFSERSWIHRVIVEGSLDVKLPTIWTDGKAEVGRVREEKRRREEERRSEKRKSQLKEDAGARKGRKVAIHCVFPMICGSGGSEK